MRRWHLAALLALMAALGGCFESDEERANRAYVERDYASVTLVGAWANARPHRIH